MAGRQMHVVWVAAILMSSGVIAQQVDMSNTSLTEIPNDTPTNITGWILSNNSLVMSTSDIYNLQKYRRIKMLDLSYNHIQMLPPGAFDKLTNLEILKLRGNSLQTLDKAIFKGVRNLKSLDLKDNPLNCSCSLTSLIKELNDSGVLIGKEVTCYTPQKTTVLDGNHSCSIQATTVKTSVEKSTATTLNTRSTSTPAPTVEPSNSSHVNSSSKGKHTSSNTPDVSKTLTCAELKQCTGVKAKKIKILSLNFFPGARRSSTCKVCNDCDNFNICIFAFFIQADFFS
uniref:Uncharacterized protein n=1 Tax=Cyprinus carpio TaxID=7962 RepID=A0A8C1VLB2_CYPCA